MEMERRQNERFRVHFEAKVATLGTQERCAWGRVSDISKSGMSVALPFELAPGEPIQLDMADSAVYGHVVYTRAESSLFRTGIEVERVLLGSTDLSMILQRALQDVMPETPGLELDTVGARID
jgi:hypothetical protein